MPTGFVFCDSHLLFCHIQCASASITHSLSAGNDMFEGVLRFNPNVIYCICRSHGHNAVVCSLHSSPRSTTSLPAMESFKPGKTLWYPDSAAVSNMTPNEAMLSARTPCSGSI